VTECDFAFGFGVLAWKHDRLTITRTIRITRAILEDYDPEHLMTLFETTGVAGCDHGVSGEVCHPSSQGKWQQSRSPRTCLPCVKGNGRSLPAGMRQCGTLDDAARAFSLADPHLRLTRVEPSPKHRGVGERCQRSPLSSDWAELTYGRSHCAN